MCLVIIFWIFISRTKYWIVCITGWYNPLPMDHDLRQSNHELTVHGTWKFRPNHTIWWSGNQDTGCAKLSHQQACLVFSSLFQVPCKFLSQDRGVVNIMETPTMECYILRKITRMTLFFCQATCAIGTLFLWHACRLFFAKPRVRQQKVEFKNTEITFRIKFDLRIDFS